jgi:predicted N-acyltransferase
MPVLCAVERVGSLDEVDDRLWGSVADPDDMYQSHSWLRALESTEDGATSYLIARQRGQSKIVGALPVFDSPTTRGDYRYWPELHFQDLLQSATLLGDRLGLLAGSCAGFRTPLVLDRTIPQSARIGVLRALLDAATALAADHGLAYVFFLFLASSARRDLAAAVGGHGHFRLAGAAQSELELPGGCFDDYLASLRKNVRTGARREMADFLGSCSAEVEPLREVVTTVAPMIAKVRAKHGMAESVEAVTRRLGVHCRALGDDGAKAVVCRANGDVVGAGVLCRWNDRLYVTDFGRHDSDEPDAFVYFNATIYEPVRYAYRAGLTRVVTGAGSEPGKARRGSTLLPLTHLALAAGGQPDPPSIDASRADEPVAHWRTERSAHPRYFGPDWDDLL